MRRPQTSDRPGRRAAIILLLALTALGATSALASVPVVHANGGSGSAAANLAGYRTGQATVQPRSEATASGLNVVTTFPGIQFATGGSSPPDVQLATGRTEVVEMVNLAEEVFTRSGASVATVSLATAFNTMDDIGDPRIVYDNASGRFFASVYDFTSQTDLIAVSKSSSAELGWTTWNINTDPSVSGYCVDNPFLGVAADKVIVTANDYVNAGSPSNPCHPFGSYAYQIVWIVNKAEVLLGGFIQWSYFYYTPNSGYFGMRPVSSPTSTAYVVCTTCGGGIVMKEFTGVPTATTGVMATTFNVPFGNPSDPVGAPILGSSDTIDTGDQRILSTAWSDGVWLAFDDGCVPAGDNALRSCARIVQISVASNQVVKSQDVYGAPGTYLFYPAVTVDPYGEVGVVVGYSSAGTYPGYLVTGVRSGENIGDLVSNEVTITTGTGYGCDYYRSTGVCRYGDYFGAAADPSDPTLMWFAGQYETPSKWGTSVAAVRIGFAVVTLSYSTQDGSVAPSSPQVTYTSNHAAKVATLTSVPTAYLMDVGTSWSVGTQLGGTSSERWVASGTPGGAVTGDTSDNVVYYHQFLVTPTYTVADGGSQYSAPSVTCMQAGASATTTAGTSVWADARSTCTFAQSLPGSSATERWAAASGAVSVASAGNLPQVYYHQYLLTLSYSVEGGGNPGGPTLASTQFGSPYSAALGASPGGYWLDSGAAWTVDKTMAGAAGERWANLGTASGTASATNTVTLTYQHQYYVTASASPSEGGSTPAINEWLNAGGSLTLNATAFNGWQFEGWNGTGTGAFSGASPNPTFTVDGPANETAVFYPGLTVTVSGSGTVQYSINGIPRTVGSGTTIYAPKGTTVTLTSSASSFLYSFSGWTGALTGSSSPAQSQLTTPASVTASFGINIVVVGGIAGVVLMAVVGGVFALKRRGGRMQYPPPPPPPP